MAFPSHEMLITEGEEVLEGTFDVVESFEVRGRGVQRERNSSSGF